ncbi:hypothetical protein PO124_18090 [Bacillus licheniformis]|nr:hypothetical protein [Bacillus licheniformis]
METFQDRKFIIVEAADQEGVTGWGKYPLFISVVHRRNNGDMLPHAQRFLIPAVLRESFTHPSEVPEALRGFKGNRMAKAGLEAAFGTFTPGKRDLFKRGAGRSKTEVPAGVVVGLAPLDDMLQEIEQYVKKDIKE